MPAFTKETWEAGKIDSKTHKNQWLIFANRGTKKEKVIAEVHDMYEIIAPRRMNALPEETEANARLIAKAPAMYELLKDILYDESSSQHMETILRLTAYIEGREVTEEELTEYGFTD